MPDQEKVINGLKRCLSPSLLDCVGCPYYNAYVNGECHSRLLVDTLELLKEQEPRLLTLDEVCSDECWIEWRNGAYGYADCVYRGCTDCTGDIVVNRTHHINNVNSKDYMRIWRCWDRKPTDGRRKAVQWDD